MVDLNRAEDIQVGYHPDGYRIDKKADPIDWYTQWEVTRDNEWKNPKAVCFHSLPESGWIKVDKFQE